MKKILYVEDNDERNILIQSAEDEMTKKVEFEIKKAVEANEAIRLLKNNTYDVIILDGRLEDSTHGRDVIDYIEKEKKELLERLIVISGEYTFLEEVNSKGIKAAKKDSKESWQLIANAIESN
jgi:CheY-like chemotaxis protein